MVNEEALAESFANVKKDIKKLEANILQISGSQAQLARELQELKNSVQKKKTKKTSKKSSKKSK